MARPMLLHKTARSGQPTHCAQASRPVKGHGLRSCLTLHTTGKVMMAAQEQLHNLGFSLTDRVAIWVPKATKDNAGAAWVYVRACVRGCTLALR